MTFQRLIAVIILLIPVFLAGYGIKLMRDTLFFILNVPYPNEALQFLAGLIFFLAGLSFIAGFVLHRDRKNNKVSARFQKK